MLLDKQQCGRIVEVIQQCGMVPVCWRYLVDVSNTAKYISVSLIAIQHSNPSKHTRDLKQILTIRIPMNASPCLNKIIINSLATKFIANMRSIQPQTGFDFIRNR